MKRLLMSSMVLLLMLFTVSTGVFANTDYDAREKLRNEGVWLTPEESAQQKAELDSMLDLLDNSANTLDSLATLPLTVQINGWAVNAPADMNVIEGQVMVPLSWAAGQLGADSVHWDSATRKVTIKTSQDFYNMEKLASYANALQSSADEQDEQIWPLPDKAKNLDLSYSVPNREWVLNLKQFKPERVGLALPIDRDQINIHITSDDGSYEHSMWVHSIENHQDHYYLPMDWLEYLFKAKVNYDQTTNVLSIQTPDLDKIKSEIALIENTLIPASADEAI
ncbi:MAG: stalk domain-containing protein, partial [Syntrophomonas sp.]